MKKLLGSVKLAARVLLARESITVSGTTTSGSTSLRTRGAADAVRFTLSGQGYKLKGFWTADLVWSGSAASDIDVFREGAKIATVNNSGTYTDATNFKGGGSLTYQVCEAGSTEACSQQITITF